MNAKQQIEEMARLLWHMPKAFYLNCYNDCCEVAKILYEECYRKQSEGEWIAYPDEHEIYTTEFVCSNCREIFCTSELASKQFLEMMKYCPNCGAKMRKEDERK